MLRASGSGVVVFFFKQKTAYEMRISDWSSDVCSSDLTRLRNICEAILADPSDGRTIDQWARTVGMSRRALTRNFRLQTGLSLAVWRQQARLEAASARLRMGEPVTRVA